tara:strand:- start:6 stop:980 length:975 start_codon:yes stop_codon:yes gene_type:complete
MTVELKNGDCLELMKSLPDKSIDLFICDLPYGETNCKWDSKIDLEEFWKQFKRLRRSKKTACIHFCSTKFGYTLIKSWEKGFKMDMVWKKRNKTGGLQSRHRPMRNHEMLYFFYEQAPKYNRDKYHKRILNKVEVLNNVEGNITNAGHPEGAKHFDKKKFFEPPNPASVIEDKDEFGWDKSVVKEKGTKFNGSNFDPPNPVSVIEAEDPIYGEKKAKRHDRYLKSGTGAHHPPCPGSVVVEDDEPVSMFESEKVFIGKRHHQTEKPQDILEFFLKYWTDEGDTVLDPTMGSGSTGVACKKMGRNFIGIELDEKIFKVAENRCPK